MELPARRSRRPSENIVPLINVVFLLLVFFMLTGRLQPAPPVEVTLPVAAESAADEAVEPHVPVLVLDAAGELWLDDAPLRPEALDARLQARPHPHRSLVLRADARAPAHVVLPLLERLEAAGVEQLDLVATLAR